MIRNRIYLEVKIVGFSHTNSRGQTYWLHKRVGKGGATLFFFSKNEDGSIDKPDRYKVIENPRTGLPMLKKI